MDFYHTRRQRFSGFRRKEHTTEPATENAASGSWKECEKDMSMVDFARQRESKKDSLKKLAVKGMCLMREENKFSFMCVVCGQKVRLKNDYKFDFKDHINQRNVVGKYLVSVARRHCQKVHPSIGIWNCLPVQNQVLLTPQEAMVHEALKSACVDVRFPESLTRFDFVAAFQDRIQKAISWLRWNKRSFAKLNRLGGPPSLRADATEELEKVSIGTFRRIQSRDFDEAMKKYNFDQLYNLLQLFFCEQGRYLRCPVFSGTDSKQIFDGYNSEIPTTQRTAANS